MKQIIIIGCPGSGKTYFAKQLSEILQIELFHMDNIYWKKDKTHISRGELISAVDRIISQSEWILDGNYISTIEQRIKAADTIFFFDYETKDCLEGVRSRIGVKRDDIPWIETKLVILQLYIKLRGMNCNILIYILFQFHQVFFLIFSTSKSNYFFIFVSF